MIQIVSDAIFDKIVAGEDISTDDENSLKVLLYAIGRGGHMLQLTLDHPEKSIGKLNISESHAQALMNLFGIFMQLKNHFHDETDYFVISYMKRVGYFSVMGFDLIKDINLTTAIPEHLEELIK